MIPLPQGCGEKSRIQTFGFHEKQPKVQGKISYVPLLKAGGWRQGLPPQTSSGVPLNHALCKGPLFIFWAAKSFPSLGNTPEMGLAMISSHCGAKLAIS